VTLRLLLAAGFIFLAAERADDRRLPNFSDLRSAIGVDQQPICSQEKGAARRPPPLGVTLRRAYWPGQTCVRLLCVDSQPFADVLVGAPKYGICANSCGCQVKPLRLTGKVP